jgi:hypothetical protein
MSRPFWQILLEMHDPEKAVTLNCDECFLYLEYMIDQALPGEEIGILIEAVRHHVDHCPDCREHHLLRIQELEERWSQCTALFQSGYLKNRPVNENFKER